jgi:hypothetical protein
MLENSAKYPDRRHDASASLYAHPAVKPIPFRGEEH